MYGARRLETCLAVALALLCLAPVGAQDFSSFVELRVYPIRDDQQARFLEFFEEHYLESQEVVGMRIWGEFRDLDDPNRVVWLRGFRSMEERLDGLKRFYSSPVWHETGSAAVSMLAGRVSHVHLLEPVADEDGFPSGAARPLLVSETAGQAAPGIVAIEVYEAESDVATTLGEVREHVVPALEAAQGRILGIFRSTEEVNDFPILPVIDDETVVVVFASFASRGQYEDARTSGEPTSVGPERLESFVLEPGPRSRLRHVARQGEAAP